MIDGEPAGKTAGTPAPRQPGSGRSGAVAQQRLAARLAAVQALYQLEASGEDAQQVVTQFLAERLEEEIDGVSLVAADRKLFGRLVTAIAEEGDALDGLLAPYLPQEWVLQRVEPLLRIILRAAAYELRATPQVPAKVVIAQYVAVTEAFHEPQETGFVNKLLDRLARSLRPADFAGASG
ncbi:MAG: transcription antitermination factor NusB [Rhodospirillales bacterium]